MDFPDVQVEDAFAAPAPALDAAAGGDLVIIVRVNQALRMFIEGLAYRGARTGRHPLEHWVTFLGESRPRRRLVLPGPFQSDPDGVIAGLAALYADAVALDSPDAFLSDVLRAGAANDNHHSSEEEA